MFCRYEERKEIKFYATEGLTEVYDLRTVTSELGIVCTDSPEIFLFIDQHNPLILKWLDCSKMPPQVIHVTTSSLHEKWVKGLCVAQEKGVSKTHLLVGSFIKMGNKIQAVNIQSDQIQWSFEEFMPRMKEKLQPRGVPSDDQGHLFVCDEANACVQIFSVSSGNKKVLLRECKRHTARRIASTRYAVPMGGGGGTYPRQGGTYLGRVVPTLAGGVPTLAGGYLHGRGDTYLGRGYLPCWGYLP